MAEIDKGKRVRPPAFKLEIPGDSVVKKSIMEKLQVVRAVLMNKLQKPVNNADILENVLDGWIQKNTDTQTVTGLSCVTELSVDQTGQEMYVISRSSLHKLVQMTQEHSQFCRYSFHFRKQYYRGHVAVCKLVCQNKHMYWWASSPSLPNGKYLVNEWIEHAVVCSGMLPAHYKRFAKGAGVGYITDKQRQSHFSTYKNAIKQEYDESTENALMREIAGYECDDNWQGIEIMTGMAGGKMLRTQVW